MILASIDLTVGTVLAVLVLVQVLVTLALRSAWVQRHEKIKAALEEEQEIAQVVTGALKHAIDNHEDGESVKDFAVSYAAKNGVDDVLRTALQRKPEPGTT